MNYEVEANWHLLNTCNYRCSYCFCSDEFLSDKVPSIASSEEWTSAFDQSGIVWLLHLTGGEPSVYPDFSGLCEGLTRRHFISINSNMTNPEWKHFARRVDPARVSFINAGIHLEERRRRNGTTTFLENVALLRDRGFQVFCSLVAEPTALARFEEAIDMLSPIGMFPVPKVMRGQFQGKRYPNAYSDVDKQRFRKFSEMARLAHEPALSRMSHRPTLDMFDDESVLDGLPSYRGVSCEAGRLFFHIDPKGEVFRCHAPKSLGNIRAGSLKRSAAPAPCNTNYCFYFCKKYAAHSNPAVDGGNPLARLIRRVADFRIQ